MGAAADPRERVVWFSAWPFFWRGLVRVVACGLWLVACGLWLVREEGRKGVIEKVSCVLGGWGVVVDLDTCVCLGSRLVWKNGNEVGVAATSCSVGWF